MRWAEMTAFTPVMRTHEGNRPDDNLQVDSNAELLAHFAAMSRVHAALAPYVRSICDEAATTGLPAQRPLFLHYSGDDAYLTCQDQYLYGRDLLVAPIITEGASEREVLLPGGEEWIHVWTGQTYSGGRHVVSAPFGSPPVFARADSPFTALFAALKEMRGATSP
jgi:alpha-glucosidase